MQHLYAIMQTSSQPFQNECLIMRAIFCSFSRIRADVKFVTRAILHLMGATKHVDRQLDIPWFCIIFNLFKFF